MKLQKHLLVAPETHRPPGLTWDKVCRTRDEDMMNLWRVSPAIPDLLARDFEVASKSPINKRRKCPKVAKKGLKLPKKECPKNGVYVF